MTSDVQERVQMGQRSAGVGEAVEADRDRGMYPSVAGFAAASAILLLLSAACSLMAQSGVKAAVTKLVTPKPNLAASSLRTYLDRVHADTTSDHPTNGSIWTENGRFAQLTTDVRAMRPNDLIQVVVSESLAASTDGTVKNSRHRTRLRGSRG